MSAVAERKPRKVRMIDKITPDMLQAERRDEWPEIGSVWKETSSGHKVEVLAVSVSTTHNEWVITYRDMKTKKLWTRSLRSWYADHRQDGKFIKNYLPA